MWRLIVPALALLLTACGTDGPVARDTDGPSSPDPARAPTSVPSATGPVATRDLVVVMDTGDGPEVCLGPVEESWPPQCSGPALTGWSWRDQPAHQRQGDVRWGSFALTGRWDGTTLEVTGAIPAALYDTMVPEPTEPPAPAVTLAPAELRQVADELGELPGATAWSSDDVHAYVGVTFDDGSLQAWADQRWGTDVVVVTSALVPR